MIKFKEILLEEFKLSDFYPESIDFLKTWISGSNQAIRKFNWRVGKDLQKSLEKDSYVLYRGYKVTDEEAFKEKFNRNIDEIKIGEDLVIQEHTFTSWTTNKIQAIEFSNPAYDSFSHDYYSEKELRDFQYNEGDLLGYGLVVTCIMPKKKLLCDTSNIRGISIGEDEIIVLNNVFRTKVLELKPYYFEIKKEDYEEEDYEEEVPEISDKQKVDLEIRTIIWMAKKYNLDLNDDEVVINLLKENYNGDFAIAFINMFKDTRPNLIKWIKENSKNFKFEELKNTAYADYLINGLD